MDCNEEPSINPRIYGAMGEDVPRPLSVEGEELTLYGYVFQVMYKAA